MSAEARGAPAPGPLTRVLWSYPVLLVASLYATWVSAWAILGHRPVPSLDDPKSIGLWVDVPYFAALALMVGWPVAWAGGVWATFRHVRRSALGACAAVLLCLLWGAALAFLRWDPLRVGEWFID